MTQENKAREFWIQTTFGDVSVWHEKPDWYSHHMIEFSAYQAEREKVRRLETIVNTAKNDYWFMINLLERYSTNKDEAIKDCIERMKFRKPMFESEKSIKEIEEV